MKNILHTFFLYTLLGISHVIAQDGQSFVTTWEATDGAITIPTQANEIYNYTLKWSNLTHPGILEGTITNRSGTYTISDLEIGSTYEIEITGTFPAIYFNNEGDKDKILTIEHWGNNAWSRMERAFYGCSRLTIPASDAPDLSNVSSTSYMFASASSFNQSINHWDVSSIQYMSYMFSGANLFDQDLGQWDVGEVLEMTGMFQNASNFNGNIGSWDVSKVTDMWRMFQDASDFNQAIGTWDVSNVERMFAMFADAESFNQDIGTWNVSKVNNMASMFEGASNFNQNLNQWDVSGVVIMDHMFSYAINFNGNITDWDMGSVKNTANMFYHASAFNQDIGHWDVSSDTSMVFMLTNAKVFNQDLSQWKVESVQNMGSIFMSTALSRQNYDKLLNEWAAQDLQNGVIFGGYAAYCHAAEAREKLIEEYQWSIIDNGALCSTETDIISFHITDQVGETQVNTEGHTVLIKMPQGTDLSKLIPEITVSTGASISPMSGEEVDFSEPVSYTIIAEDNESTQDWLITVVYPSSATDILNFRLAQQTHEARIDQEAHTVDIEVAYGTDLTALVPEVIVSGDATVTPTGGERIDFSTPVTYTVLAEDNITQQDWKVVVSVALPNTHADIIAFVADKQIANADIDLTNHSIALKVSHGTDLTSLSPEVIVSAGATVTPASGEYIDFSEPVIYTVLAEDNITQQDWIVSVTAPNNDTEILDFSFGENTSKVQFDNELPVISVEVEFGTDLSTLTPETRLSEGATITIAPGIEEDFTKIVTYIVTAEDEINTKHWIIIVSEADEEENNGSIDGEGEPLSNEVNMLAFSVNEEVNSAKINSQNHTVELKVADGTNITALIPNITISNGATVSPESGILLDFTEEVEFVVTAEDGKTTQTWTVSVEIENKVLGIDVPVTYEIYPNPVEEYLEVKSPKIVTAKITDLNGTTVLPSQTGKSLTINLGALSDGIYILQLRYDTYVTNQKIIKLR